MVSSQIDASQMDATVFHASQIDVSQLEATRV